RWISRGRVPLKRKHTILAALGLFVLFATFAINDSGSSSKPTISPSASVKVEESKQSPTPEQPKIDDNKSTSQPNSESAVTKDTTTPAPTPVTTPAPAADASTSTPTAQTVSTPPVVVEEPTSNPVPAVTTVPAEPTKQVSTVYITKSGKKYHNDGCRSLSSSKISISLTDAKAKGYTPCSICDPPQ
ncbi:MAG TPA: hypothetical protein VN456_07655, partial [Desulfosporosinus sp.]|nr:hypothetical protein [Desulfosporosinus sp.]